MRYVLILVSFLYSIFAQASLPLRVELSELVKNTDHLLVGHVVGVDMINDKGDKITDSQAMTGPGIDNIIRLKIEIDETVISNSVQPPKIIMVPLDPFMHHSLGQIQRAHDGDTRKFLLLLKGRSLSPPFPGNYRRELSEKEEILKLFNMHKKVGGEN